MLHEVRTAAYYKWEAAGCPQGDGVDFWLTAEEEHWEKSNDKLGKAIFWLCKMPHYNCQARPEWPIWCKLVFNFLTNDMLAKLEETKTTFEQMVDYFPWLREDIPALLFLRHKGVLSATQVKEVFGVCWTGVDALTAILQLDILNEMQADVLEATVARHLAEKPKVIEDYKKGKKQALNSLIGPILKELGGKADATRVRAALEEQANRL